MKKSNAYILDMRIRGNSEVGDCLIKCLQEICYWYGYPLNTYSILGIINGFNLKNEGNGIFSIIREMERFYNSLFPGEFKKGKKVEECLEDLYMQISLGNPVIALLNTYYLKYTDDYLKVSGGFFKSFHSVIVTGYDADKRGIYVTDLIFEQYNTLIDLNEFCNAWTYTEDAPNFRPLNYISYSCLEKNKNVRKVLLDSLIYSIEMYLEDYYDWKNKFSKRNVFAIIGEFEKIIDVETLSDGDCEVLSNLAYSIFHEVRWSRKSMGLFLKSEEIRVIGEFEDIAEGFVADFEEWTLIHNMISICVLQKNICRLKKIYSKIYTLIIKETEWIERIKSQIIISKNI